MKTNSEETRSIGEIQKGALGTIFRTKDTEILSLQRNNIIREVNRHQEKVSVYYRGKCERSTTRKKKKKIVIIFGR